MTCRFLRFLLSTSKFYFPNSSKLEFQLELTEKNVLFNGIKKKEGKSIFVLIVVVVVVLVKIKYQYS